MKQITRLLSTMACCLFTTAFADAMEEDPYYPAPPIGSYNYSSRPWDSNFQDYDCDSGDYSDDYHGNGNGNGHGGSNGNGNGNGDKKSSGAGNAGNSGNSYKGGAGVRPKGNTTVYLGYDLFSTDHFFTGEGDKKAIGSTIFLQNYTGYVEYGLTERDTVSANVIWTRIRQTNTSFPNIMGFRDIDLTWKRLLWECKDSAFSASFTLTVPSGSHRDQYIAIRAGEFAETILLYYSHEFKIGNRDSGIDFSAGYQFRQGFPSDAILLASGWRLSILDPLLFIASLNLYDSVGNGRPISLAAFANPADIIDDEVTNPTIRNSRLLLGTLYLAYSFSEHFDITVGIYRNLWGRYVGAQTGYFAGLTVSF